MDGEESAAAIAAPLTGGEVMVVFMSEVIWEGRVVMVEVVERLRGE